ncbi:hypothetical protein GYMLUDRAFT_37885 [Collybiopsis luxurians FD-317 M1]|nr:hypothetical protein GYMLUDRAFT_37885 [Collybiopsis luxurians FD-317 M1]
MESEWELIDDWQDLWEEESSTLSVEAQITAGATTAFSSAHHFTLNNLSFVVHHGNNLNTTYYRKIFRKPKLSRGINKWKNLNLDFSTIPKYQIDSGKVICVRKGSRFYTATRYLGSSMASTVIVQEFEGSTGKLQWENTLRCAPHSLNPHILDIVGISPPSLSNHDNPRYIVFQGARRLNPRRLIASMLVERDRERLAGVGSQVVYSIASALDYLSNASTALRLADIGIENFDVFSDENGSSTVRFTPNPAGLTPQETEMSDVGVCNSFMTKLFSDANYILHREKLDRTDHDLIDKAAAVDGHELSGLKAKDRSKAADSNKETAENSDGIRCRREIIWMSRDFDMTLSEMSESYGDLLDLRLPSEGKGDSKNRIPLPQRSGKRRSEVQHECSGYRREEITLTPDAFRNEVLVFLNPSVNERCCLCGQIVQLQSSQQFAPSLNFPYRSKGGCWTCRVRRKKCDGRPDAEGRCETCVRLHLQCIDYDVEHPTRIPGENTSPDKLCDTVRSFQPPHSSDPHPRTLKPESVHLSAQNPRFPVGVPPSKPLTLKGKVAPHGPVADSGEESPYPGPLFQAKFKCLICGYRFVAKHNLMNHLNLHLNKCPHECSKCGNLFNTRGTHVRYVCAGRPVRKRPQQMMIPSCAM